MCIIKIGEPLMTELCQRLYKDTGTMSYTNIEVLWAAHGKLWVREQLKGAVVPSRFKADSRLESLCHRIKFEIISPIFLYEKGEDQDSSLIVRAAKSFIPYWFEEETDPIKNLDYRNVLYTLFVNEFKRVLGEERVERYPGSNQYSHPHNPMVALALHDARNQ